MGIVSLWALAVAQATAPWAAFPSGEGAATRVDPFAELQLAADVAHLAARPRADEAARAQTRAWLVQQLEALGFATAQPDVPGWGGQSVVGTALGALQPERQVVVGAHFDTVAGSKGADDNASGVAALLAVARAQAARGPQPSTLVLCLWDLEERGLRGSEAWAAEARAAGQQLAHTLVLEMVGYRDTQPLTQRMPWSLAVAYPKTAWRLFKNGRRGDFVALVGNDKTALGSVGLALEAAGLPAYSFFVPRWLMPLARFSDLWRSDHASLWSEDFSATMVTDTANLRNPHYHRPDDLPDTLDYDFMAKVARAVDQWLVDMRRPLG